MPPDERRSALIEATIPLLLEHGSGVSTRQIAEAAGVAEGTIFRVFDSKEDILHACATQVLSRDGLADGLATLPPDADLATTVAHIGRALSVRINDVRTVIALLHEQGSGRFSFHGHAHERPGGPVGPEASSTCRRPDPRALHEAVVETVASALAPHADALRTTPRVAATALIALTFGAGHTFAGDPALTDGEALADLILHGIQKDA